MTMKDRRKRPRQSFLLLTGMALLCVALLVQPLALQGASLQSPTTLRVALGLDLPSAEFAVAEGSYELIDYLTQQVISADSANHQWVVTPVGINNLIVSDNINGQVVSSMGSSTLLLRQKNSSGLNVFSFKNKRYRGDLMIINLQGKIQAINLIDIEQYLYGVVGAEMGQGASLEAYKAQAVVSRTYALFCKENPQLNYDLGINTRWQVYGGYDTELLSNSLVKRAVDDTRGQVIYYDGRLIKAFFHSNSGGYTEACENVWSECLPYLQPVASPEDAMAGQFSTWGGETYSWEKTLTRDELNTQLANSCAEVGKVRSLLVKRLAIDPASGECSTKPTSSGRVTQLDVVGSKGTKSFFKDNIRTILGLKSTLFEIVCDSTVKVWNAFGLADEINNTVDFYGISGDGYKAKLNGNNANYYVLGADGLKTMPKDFSIITFKGKGNGHGLGMSQWGARGMAQNGKNYKSIIEHYYNQGRFDGRLSIGQYRS
ncbi:MAG: SpoIID/LytB domain-containing protein [Peptococcia bacterium]